MYSAAPANEVKCLRKREANLSTARGCKNPNDKTRSGRPKIVDSETLLQVIETDLVSSTQRVSGELIAFTTSAKASGADVTKILTPSRNFFVSSF